MGFRKDAWATCWSVEPKSDSMTIVRISTNCKNKDGEFEQDFGEFVAFVGTATAKKAAQLKEKDRIKLGNVEVKTKYEKEKKTTYYNFKCYDFELSDKVQTNNSSDNVEANEMLEGIAEESKLPF